MTFKPGQSGNPKGRPPNAKKYAEQRETATTHMHNNLMRYVQTLEELAWGIWIEERLPDGTNRLYKRAPDRAALIDLMNRALGKPTERLELTLEKPLEEMSDEELEAVAAGKV